MKKIYLTIIAMLVLSMIGAIFPFGTFQNATAWDGQPVGLDNPNFQLNQPYVPYSKLSSKDRAKIKEKLQKFNEWLKKQKDIDSLDTPLKNFSGSSVIKSGEINIPLRKMEEAWYCGPATCQEVLDYNWGYLYDRSKYSQSELADDMGTTEENGTWYPNLTQELNNKQRPYSFYWIYSKAPNDETREANNVYNYTRWDIDGNEGLIYLVNTYPHQPGDTNPPQKSYFYDAWGERYGLVGYYNPNDGDPSSSKQFHATGHFVTGYGYLEYSSGRHCVMYLDSNDHSYKFGNNTFINPYGRHVIDARNMATCVIGRNGTNYIIW